MTPNAAERDYVNRISFDELCAGEFTTQARARGPYVKEHRPGGRRTARSSYARSRVCAIRSGATCAVREARPAG